MGEIVAENCGGRPRFRLWLDVIRILSVEGVGYVAEKVPLAFESGFQRRRIIKVER